MRGQTSFTIRLLSLIRYSYLNSVCFKVFIMFVLSVNER